MVETGLRPVSTVNNMYATIKNMDPAINYTLSTINNSNIIN
jgi:hypothetical protein